MANAQLAEIVQVRRAFSQTAHALPRFCHELIGLLLL
jgi:hypothetical protein